MIFVFAQISWEGGKCGIFQGNATKVLIIYMDIFILFILIKQLTWNMTFLIKFCYYSHN